MNSADSFPAATSDPLTVVEETELVDALRRGEPQAYERLVRTHGGRLLTVARRFLSNEEDARDAVQDAFLSAFRAIDRFEGQSRLATWLHRIVVNAALMKLRGRKAGSERSIEDLLPRYAEDGHALEPAVDWQPTAEEILSRRETRELVRQAIDELPQTHRTVLLLRDIEGVDTSEAAAMLGVNEGAIKTRLHRARQALRELLDVKLRGAGR